MAIKQAIIDKLGSYLEIEGPNGSGEWGMLCPLHDDTKRSASLNMETGLWYCQACEEGGPVELLIRKMDPSSNGSLREGKDYEYTKPAAEAGPFPFTDQQVKSWTAALLTKPEVLEELMVRRGLTMTTITNFEIGWSLSASAYTIPIRDVNGELVNIRYYQLDPGVDRRKIWGVTGHNEPTLYPIDELCDAQEVVWCEGEWDALLTIQNGHPAVTRTGSAGVWKPEWTSAFTGKTVYVCQDSDVPGQAGSRKVKQGLKDVANVFLVTLPYPIEDKSGKDLTDFWLDNLDLDPLIAAARDASPHVDEIGRREIKVIDSLDADLSGERLRMTATVIGKKDPPYMVPREMELSCTLDAGKKCDTCSLQSHGGVMRRTVLSDNPLILSMLDVSAENLLNLIRLDAGIAKCAKIVLEVEDHQPVSEIFIRPNIDEHLSVNESGDYTERRVYAVNEHQFVGSDTIEIIGTVYPNPKTQRNEFLAYETNLIETSIDNFSLDADMVDHLSVFHPLEGQSPADRMNDIVSDLTANVTRIYGRPRMHVFMDIVLHSALSFDFMGKSVYRGWLDGIIVGDTRTGKSEAASQLIDHYRLGEMISCESASFAGLVGGLSKMGESWQMSWGCVPINDRRAVVLDEVSGMTPEEIAQMSSIRSSGRAEITKIKSEKTHARTRLLWLGNPRDSKMSDFTYGALALKPLIGNNEDIARFDMAMAVMSSEVSGTEINSMNHPVVKAQFTSDLCHDLLLWIWSRTADQIVWAKGTEKLVLDGALELGDTYVENPPLVQVANVREKIARVAVAIAGRLFSSDESGQSLVVQSEHVAAAMDFLKAIYDDHNFGYGEISSESHRDQAKAIESADFVMNHLSTRLPVAKFFRSGEKFKKRDLDEAFSMDHVESKTLMDILTDGMMIRREGPYYRCSSVFQDILRRLK